MEEKDWFQTSYGRGQGPLAIKAMLDAKLGYYLLKKKARFFKVRCKEEVSRRRSEQAAIEVVDGLSREVQ